MPRPSLGITAIGLMSNPPYSLEVLLHEEILQDPLVARANNNNNEAIEITIFENP